MSSPQISPPTLKSVSFDDANTLVENQSKLFYGLADTQYATGYTAPLPPAATSLVNQLGGEIGGGIPVQATDALNTAGLSDVASRIPGKTEGETERNLGVTPGTKENRDRNMASRLLSGSVPYFKPRAFSLSPNDVAQIAAANSGNVNAFQTALSSFQSQQGQLSTLQNANDITALANLFTSGSKVYSNLQSSPYVNPYVDPYNAATPPFGSYDLGGETIPYNPDVGA